MLTLSKLYDFDKTTLLNAIYDTAEEQHSKIFDTDSRKGYLHLKIGAHHISLYLIPKEKPKGMDLQLQSEEESQELFRLKFQLRDGVEKKIFIQQEAK